MEQLLQQRQQEQKPPEPPAEEDKPEQTGQKMPGQNSDNQQQGSNQSDAEKPGEQPGEPQEEGNNQTPGTPSGDDDDTLTQAPQRPTGSNLDAEQRQALEQWLRQIPDNPAQLLRRKFWYEQQQLQETHR